MPETGDPRHPSSSKPGKTGTFSPPDVQRFYYAPQIISGGQTGADRAGLDFAKEVELSSNTYPVGPDRPREESDAFSRQSKALNEIDEAIRSDEPAGEKLKKSVEDHSEACDEIKEELAGHKEGTMTQSSPLSE